MSNDYVLCDSCGKKLYNSLSGVITDNGFLCKACFREQANDEEQMPIGCRACGGPYPDCKTSCAMYD